MSKLKMPKGRKIIIVERVNWPAWDLGQGTTALELIRWLLRQTILVWDSRPRLSCRQD